MSRIAVLTVAGALTIIGMTWARTPASLTGRIDIPAGASPVVVELFTSEGCSSCPPADRLLSELSASAGPDASVIILSEHVDYWNRLGWTDPFSARLFTERQQRYAGQLPSDVYTPQMIVDGRRQFIGSDRSAAAAAIHEAAADAKLGVELTSDVSGGRINAHVTVRVAASSVPRRTPMADADVILAVTEDGLLSQVTAGENAGRRLPHAGVVRAMITVGKTKRRDDSAAFDAALPLDSHWAADRLRIVAIVQRRADGAIIGAASALPGAQRDARLERR